MSAVYPRVLGQTCGASVLSGCVRVGDRWLFGGLALGFVPAWILFAVCGEDSVWPLAGLVFGGVFLAVCAVRASDDVDLFAERAQIRAKALHWRGRNDPVRRAAWIEKDARQQRRLVRYVFSGFGVVFAAFCFIALVARIVTS